MNEIIKRVTNESPSFFKKIQAIALTLAAAGGAILLIPASVVVFPPAILTMAGYFVTAGAVAAAVAKTPVVDPKVLEETTTKPTPQVQSTVKPE